MYSTECDCCDAITYHIPLDSDALTYCEEDGIVLHLTEDELAQFYWQLKEHVCQ